MRRGADRTVTLVEALFCVALGFGLGTIVHAWPFQCSIRVW